MKKITLLLLVLFSLCSAMVPMSAKSRFSDVKGQYAWASDYVDEMASKGLISGYEDGTYRPEKSVSRMEAFALFARLMGSSAEINKDVLAIAKSKYTTILKTYNLSYAEGDVAFMLLKGVISENELDRFFKGDNKYDAMPRYEAAILIAKSMGMHNGDLEGVGAAINFIDADRIPNDARSCVRTVSKLGIMSGMGDGSFSPETKVNRGQIAVMLSKTLNIIDYAFECANIISVDTVSKNIEFVDTNGEIVVIGYNDDTKFDYSNSDSEGEKTIGGMQAVITYCTKNEAVVVAYVDIVREIVLKDKLPKVLMEYGYNGDTISSVMITDFRYEADDYAKLYFTGEKLTDSRGSGTSSSCKISWKLYDEEGYVVDSDTTYSSAVKKKEKFRDAMDYTDDLAPGTYYLELDNTR